MVRLANHLHLTQHVSLKIFNKRFDGNKETFDRNGKLLYQVKSKKFIPETEYHILASNADQLKSGAHMTTVLPTPKPFTSVETFERSNLFPPFFFNLI